MSNTAKTHMFVDFSICLIMAAIYGTASFTTRDVNFILFIRLTLVFWLMFLSTRVLHLLQYMASFDIDLTRYLNLNLNSIEIPYKHKVKMWKQYLLKPKKFARPISLILLLMLIAKALGYFPVNLWKETFSFFLIVYTTVFSVTIAVEIGKFIAGFQARHKLNIDERYGKNNIIKNIMTGLFFGILFAASLVYFFDMPRFHFFLYFLAFSMLFSFSKIFYDLYSLFSHAIYQTLGHKLNQIPLTMRSSLYS